MNAASAYTLPMHEQQRNPRSGNRFRLSTFTFRLFCCAAVVVAASASAQQYPVRPVRVIVPLTPGGGVDIIARVIADHYSQVMGQRFIVDNRPGAGGTIGVETVAKAAPDGQTLLVSSSSMVTNAAIQVQRYDPIRDFQPVTKLTSNSYVVLVTPSLPVSSAKDLVALARSQPGRVSYASSGVGGVLHLGAELFCSLTGVQMTHVPYKGVAEAYPAVVSGLVNWVLGNPLSAAPLMKAGRVKGIAVTGAARMKALPDLPTVAESGVPGYAVEAWFALFAPARTPAATVSRLHVEAAKAIHAPEIARRFEAEGTDMVGNPPQEFTREVKAEYEKWRALVAKAGLKIQ
jgi:tripartite-type tricarboxylate transporter receptor subunit TctC